VIRRSTSDRWGTVAMSGPLPGQLAFGIFRENLPRLLANRQIALANAYIAVTGLLGFVLATRLPRQNRVRAVA
jgi:hypothetical protein